MMITNRRILDTPRKAWIIIILLFFFGCKNTGYQLTENEKAFFNYKNLVHKDGTKAFNAVVELTNLNTFDRIKSFKDSICKVNKFNENMNKCYDRLSFLYNYKDLTFKPHQNNRYNIEIPAFQYSCNRCFVDFYSSKNLDINMITDTIFIIDHQRRDTITSLSHIYERLDLEFSKVNTQFVEGCSDYKSYIQSDTVFDQYIASRIFDPLSIRVHISEQSSLLSLEPLIEIIYKSYIKSLRKTVKELTKKELRKIDQNELKLFIRYLYLDLTISPTLPE